MEREEEPPFPSEEEIETARDYLFRLLLERAEERRSDRPTDFGGGCKFGSLLALALFGGELQGNWMHQYVILREERLDLTRGDGVEENVNSRITMLRMGVQERDVGWVNDPFQHDSRWWLNADHVQGLESCLPRVRRWVERWRAEGRPVRGALPDDFHSLAKAHRRRLQREREQRGEEQRARRRGR